MNVVPTISVVIPNYNYGRYLAETLESVFAQTLPPHEVIVVDDGSTDNSSEILSSYGDRVRVVRQQNRGVAAARNAGIELATGEFVAFLDADDIWLPQKLERQVERFLADPEIGLVLCGGEEIDERGVRLGQLLTDGMEGWIAKEMLLFERTTVLLPGSGALVPRPIFKTIGEFDGRLPPSEDWDISYRIARRYKVGFVPEVLIQYRIHGTNSHMNIRRMERGMLIAFSKAFAEPDPQLQAVRRRAYGNLHMILAGSFFRAGQYRDFTKHALKSLWFTPHNYTRLVGFPRRLWQRYRLAATKANLSTKRTTQ